jgi:hypothetical protein
MMLARKRERNLPDWVDASWGQSRRSGRLLQQNHLRYLLHCICWLLMWRTGLIGRDATGRCDLLRSDQEAALYATVLRGREAQDCR